MNEAAGRARYCDGYYETMIAWMRGRGFARQQRARQGAGARRRESETGEALPSM